MSKEILREIGLLIRAKKNFNTTEEIYRIYNNNPQKFIETIKSEEIFNLMQQAIRAGDLEFIVKISEIYYMSETVSKLYYQKHSEKNVKDIRSILGREFHRSEIRPPLKNKLFEPKIIDELKTVYQSSLLGYSVTFDKYEIAKWLLENGAEVNFPQNSSQVPPMIMSVFSTDERIFFLLLDNKADIFVTDEKKNTVLHHAVSSNKINFVQKLLNLDANINQRNNEGDSALTIASREGNLEIIKILVQHAEEQNIKLIDIESAIAAADGPQQKEIIKILRTSLESYEAKAEEALSVGLASTTPSAQKNNIYNLRS